MTLFTVKQTNLLSVKQKKRNINIDYKTHLEINTEDK